VIVFVVKKGIFLWKRSVFDVKTQGRTFGIRRIRPSHTASSSDGGFSKKE
jgi:hypothetical protein